MGARLTAPAVQRSHGVGQRQPPGVPGGGAVGVSRGGTWTKRLPGHLADSLDRGEKISPCILTLNILALR